MKLKLGILAGLSLLLLGGTAYADTLDPLHGEVCATSTTCSGAEVGSHTDMPVNSTFGFAISPGSQTGTLLLVVLTPNNDGNVTDTISGNGLAENGVGLGTSRGVWSSGTLAQFLTISADPSNPIGAYLPDAQTLDTSSSFTGFNVYLVGDSADMTLPSEQGTLPDEFKLTSALPEGSFVTGFFDVAGTEVATANSGALFVDAAAVSQTPLPATAPLFIGGIGLLGWLTRKGKPQCRA